MREQIEAVNNVPDDGSRKPDEGFTKDHDV
jgi:hypothetical protein